ncbi:hypothetical protein CF392_09520 [Tamilnaduibacter salinus]|uniref:Uncharacterized protein n=1 Tax=Tamilnaduibacter salinus TaxID=1484056 RepID=A0A2A2I3Q0_9GAMM|nr:hypothetical protein [Tamilnaduibacter salinus]PAV25755.1 hypothetical protein CF392_09520 [Tamilnaduibacter salinus]
MTETWAKWLDTWGLAIVVVAVALSFLFGVPYAYTLIGFAVWGFFGHLVTLDDNEPGGFGNPEESRPVWRGSLKELGVKFLILTGLAVAVVVFPILQELGAR